MAFPISYRNENGCISLAYVFDFSPNLFIVAKGPNEGSLIFKEDVLTGA